MARRNITNLWDRDMRNAIDQNFIELYNEYTAAGINAKDARDKAEQAITDSLIAKETAEVTREEMLAIIQEQTRNGDLAPEITQARQGKSTLGDNLDAIKLDIAQKAETQFESITVKVPTDFSSINEAIRKLSEKKVKRGVVIDILIESGYKIKEPIYLLSGDYSHFQISSEDDVVYLAPTFQKREFMILKNCHGPTLNCLINGGGLCTDGISVSSVAKMTINRNCGFTHAGHNNLIVRYGGTANAEYGTFTHGSQDGDGNEGYAGITGWGGIIYAYGADASQSKTYGVRSAHGGIFEFGSGKANDCGRHGVRSSNGATINCPDAQANDCGVHGFYALAASKVNAYNASAKNAGNTGVYAIQASEIDARRVAVDGSLYGVVSDQTSNINVFQGSALNCIEYAVYATRLSKVNARSINILGSKKGIFTEEGSEVNCRLSTIDGCSLNSLHAKDGSKIIADVSVIKNTQPGNQFAHGVLSEGLSQITVSGGQVYNSGGDDLRVNTGGMIYATGTTTTKNVGVSSQPHLEDTNVTSFNTWGRLGVVIN